jgi:RNA 2',3'-cyclic 3'-phosphodiesterase
MRAFIAIELPEAVKQELSQVQRRLRAEIGDGVRWVNTDGVHLTLKFLGEVGPRSIPAIEAALRRVSQEQTCFSARTGELGAFPNPRRPRVLWVGVAGSVENLLKLQRMVDEALTSLGFAAESRSFSAHLTLGRVNDGASRQVQERIGKALAAGKVDNLQIPVDGVSLMESRLTPRGASYSQVAFLAFRSRPIELI